MKKPYNIDQGKFMRLPALIQRCIQGNYQNYSVKFYATNTYVCCNGANYNECPFAELADDLSRPLCKRRDLELKVLGGESK